MYICANISDFRFCENRIKVFSVLKWNGSLVKLKSVCLVHHIGMATQYCMVAKNTGLPRLSQGTPCSRAGPAVQGHLKVSRPATLV